MHTTLSLRMSNEDIHVHGHGIKFNEFKNYQELLNISHGVLIHHTGLLIYTVSELMFNVCAQRVQATDDIFY